VFEVAAQARVERYAVLVGNNHGTAQETPLRYAEDDAVRLKDVLEQLGGFPAENLVLIRNGSADSLTRALIATNDRIRATTSGGGRAVLFVYYSGHADAEALHLGASRLELRELEQLVRGSAAGFRILVLDACRSGRLTHVKGGKLAPPFDVELERTLASEGTVFLTASAAGEDAQESDELAASFFTHYFVSGLLGAADQDENGAVTLDEAYRYAYENTLRSSSRTAGNVQHPTFEYDLRGQGTVVVTMPERGRPDRATLSFPPGRFFLVLQGDADGRVVAELGARERTRRLSVRPGRYFLRSRGPTSLLEGTVTASAGRETLIDESRLVRVEYGRLVRKGEGIRRVAHGLEVGYQVRTPLYEGAFLCQGGFVGYVLELAALSIEPRLAFCRDTIDGVNIATTAYDADLELRLTHAWDIGRWTLSLGGGGGLGLLYETFVIRGKAPDRASAAAQLAGEIGVGRDLARHLYWQCRAEGLLFLFDRQDAEGRVTFGSALAVRGSLGLGWHF